MHRYTSFVFTNSYNGQVGYTLLEKEFKNYILGSYNWNDEDWDTIVELFYCIDFEDYIFVNKSDILIDDEGLIEEIYNCCDEFMDA